MSGYLITDRRGVKTIPELDVKDPEVATTLVDMPLSRVDSTIEPYTPEPAIKEKPHDIGYLKLHFGEFLRHHSIAADSKGFKDQFRKLLPGVVGDANMLVMNDLPVATFRWDGKLVMTKLEKEQPHIIAKYTRMVTKPEFDAEAFRKDMPEVFEAYRARSLRLKTAGPGTGLILPTAA